MLIARLLTHLRNMKTLHVFILEIVAVFIGISASLIVDDWRQEQQDREILDHLLQATHFNALQDKAYVDGIIVAEQAALSSALALAYDDVSMIPDEDLVELFDMAAADVPLVEIQSGYQRLLNTTLSIPFDHTMAELDYVFVPMRLSAREIAALSEQLGPLRRKIRGAAGLPEDSRNWSMDFVDEPGQQMNAVLSVMSARAAYLTEISDAETIREALRRPDVQDMLRDLITIRLRSNYHYINFGGFNDQVIRTVRIFDPDITLPIAVIELSGDATSTGWSDGLPMRRDERNPNLWHIRAELSDGPLKFRADGSFASNWGAPNSAENRVGTVGFDFGGDPASVFPSGTAEFVGLNIPVTAGTYDVTFNSQSFEYSFEPVDSGGKTDD